MTEKTAVNAPSSAADLKSQTSSKFELKTPKGTKDFGPGEMAIREVIFSKIISVFKRHGAVTIETPAFELKEVLTGKYGEDSKLIYDLQDQGGELCSLRYDLTVPFARFLAMNKSIKNIKRYQIAKVYRRDQPVMTKGRFREFYQCDFDIAGENFERMVPDAEVVKVMEEVLEELEIGKFSIKLNNRKVLDGIFEVAGVREDLYRSISSAVDKLDKVSWNEVKAEMIQKGLTDQIADTIGEYVRMSGGPELIDKLLSSSSLKDNNRAVEGLEDLRLLFKYMYYFGVKGRNVNFDLSLARGLDYYTGTIIECVAIEGPEGVGSVVGGGRYDDLVGMFGNTKIPCVGASLGIERLYSIIEAKTLAASSLTGGIIKAVPTQVFVAAAGADLLEERMQLCNELWKAGLRVEMTMKRRVKALDQFGYCEKNGIEYAIVIGPEEIEKGNVKLRYIADRREEIVPRDCAISKLKNLLGSAYVDNSLPNQLDQLKI
jgi:histidyl-tRNA synthetase